MKKVSVLLSTYNGEKYLRELLDSVLAQDTMDGELEITLFVRDDGSRDGTAEILREYAEKGLLIFANGNEESVNIGFAKSFSYLINNAPVSDYYCFCDQDDVWLTKKISCAVTALEKEDDSLPLLYSTSLIVVDENLKEITRETHLHLSKNSPTQFEENLLQNNTYGCTIVVNHRLKELYSTVPSEKIKYHDYVMTVIASGVGKFIFEENPQILYRQHGNNTVGFYKGSFKNIVRSVQFFFKNDLKNSKFQNVVICKDYFYDMLPENYKTFVDMLVNYRTDKKKKKQLKKFIKKNIKNKFIKNYSLFLIRFNKF